LELHGVHADLRELMAVSRRIEDLEFEALEYESDSPRAATPPADLLDLGQRWQLRLEVPGVELGDLDIALQGDQLVVAGVRRPVEEGASAIFRERGDGAFQRSFTLPGPVQSEAVGAHLRSGLLIVDLPKLGDDEA
jgi:HSP20 family protein